MAGNAVHWRHSAYLYVFLLMADVTDRPRGLKAMQGNRMALGAGDVLLPSVYLVTDGGCYLDPLKTTTLMTFFTSLVRDYRVLFHSLKTPEDEINNQLGAGKQTLSVAAMASWVSVNAGRPAIPGLLHDVASSAEVRIRLRIVIEMDKLIATKGDGT